MADAVSILAQYGLQNADAIVTAAQLEGVELAVAAAMVEKESGGASIWGHDPVATGGVYTPGGPVTASNYLAYRALVRAGKIGRQGCGPAQLTSAAYQDLGDAIGAPAGLGCWDPVTNLRAGLRGLQALIKSYGSVQLGAQHYNGSGPAAVAYGEDFLARYGTWKARLAGATVPPPEDALTDEEHAMLVACYQQMSGSATVVQQWPGWPTWPGGSQEHLSLLDYLRRQNQRMEALTAKVDALAAKLSAS